jgi:hypothetical protein
MLWIILLVVVVVVFAYLAFTLDGWTPGPEPAKALAVGGVIGFGVWCLLFGGWYLVTAVGRLAFGA